MITTINDVSEPEPPLVEGIGTLTDDEIVQRATSAALIQDFDENNVRQACYDLRASDKFWALPNGEMIKVEREFVLEPLSAVVVITKESIKLPPDMLGRVCAKGQLFSLGVAAVSTYADPGFEGPLGIVLHNLSRSYIRIEVGSSVAKIEFTRLKRAVTRPYKGPYGHKSAPWPIHTNKILSAAEVAAYKNDRNIGVVAEIARQQGDAAAALMQLVLRFERRYFLVLLSVAGLLLLAAYFLAGAAQSIAVGVAVALIGGFIVMGATAVVTRIKEG